METKICKGVLHPEGVELPIDMFGKISRILKKDNIRHYYIHTYCKKCICESTRIYQKNNPEVHIRGQRKYKATDRCKIKSNEYGKKWYKNNKNSTRLVENLKKSRKKRVEEITYSYVKHAWINKFKSKGLPAPEFTGDIYLVERIRIYTKRKINESKQRTRGIIPDNARNS